MSKSEYVLHFLIDSLNLQLTPFGFPSNLRFYGDLFNIIKVYGGFLETRDASRKFLLL